MHYISVSWKIITDRTFKHVYFPSIKMLVICRTFDLKASPYTKQKVCIDRRITAY